METLKRTTIISAKPDEVFAFMDNIENTGMHMMKSNALMMGSKLIVEWLTESKTGPGSKYRWRGKVMGIKMDFTVEVTKWIQGKEKVWETVGDAKMIILSWFRMYLILTPEENGTRVETYIQIRSDVKGKRVVLVCTLHQPDDKLLPLYFLSKTAKDLGADCTCLIAPYLAYMRQDTRFHPGEAITSEYFGALISQFAETLITVDPHLHRRSSLSEVYSVPCKVLHAASPISAWIKDHIEKPVLVGPDSESEQWVSEVAENAGAPFIILEKIRHGDKDVEVSVPQVEAWKNHTPILVDDIISTARTMIETVGHLNRAGMKAPVCIGVHAIFAGNAYRELINAGTAAIVTCNTILHESNRIDISALLTEGYNQFWNK